MVSKRIDAGRARNAARLQKLRLELERDSMTSGRDYRRSASTDLSKPAPYDAYDKEGEEEREKDQVCPACICATGEKGTVAVARPRLHGLPTSNNTTSNMNCCVLANALDFGC